MGQRARVALTVVAVGAVVCAGCDSRLGQALRQRPSLASAAQPVAPPPPLPAPTQTGVTPRTEAPSAAKVLSQAFTAAAQAIRPSVVRIDVQRGVRRLSWRSRSGQSPFLGPLPRLFQRFFDFGEGPAIPELPPPRPMVGTGSGFVIDGAGVIITNSHVVEGGATLKATFFDGQEIDAKVVGKDRRTDVALVRLAKPPRQLTVARLGDSNKLQIGQWVLAVGSPLGLDQTVTAGIISGMGRVGRNVQMSGDRVRRYIQTDAKINPGNSGGPLVSLDGEVVGINTLIRVGAGGAYGFAVPINEAYRVAQILLKDGRIRYPYLGVNLRDLDSLTDGMRKDLGSKALKRGAFVVEVIPGSPAAKAGIKPGDVITRLDRSDVALAEDVVASVSSRNIGDNLEITVSRGGEAKTMRATLAEAPSDEEVTGGSPKLGLSLQTLTEPLAQALGLPNLRGAVVTDVAPDSPAERAGLQAGDVIIEIDRKQVSSADEAAAALAGQGRHLLRVRNQQGVRFITLTGG